MPTKPTKGYQIEVALPGLKRDDIKVDFHQGGSPSRASATLKTSKTPAATT
jgi:HSP20 family molecular chaperone IbpA